MFILTKIIFGIFIFRSFRAYIILLYIISRTWLYVNTERKFYNKKATASPIVHRSGGLSVIYFIFWRIISYPSTVAAEAAESDSGKSRP